MNGIEYEKLAKFERSYWWHKGKLSLVRSALSMLQDKIEKNPEILEVGCGTGEVLNLLSKYGNASGLDISSEALEFCRKRGLTHVFLEDLNAVNLNTYGNRFDVIVALDVLEHIQDDMNAMANIHGMLKKGGVLFISVPAHKFLWSTHDEALHHKRRYHRYELTQKLIDSNFRILKNTYFVSLTFPIIIFYRLLTNALGRDTYPKTTYVSLPEYMNTMFTKTLEWEAKVIQRINIPFGASIVILARKQ